MQSDKIVRKGENFLITSPSDDMKGFTFTLLNPDRQSPIEAFHIDKIGYEAESLDTGFSIVIRQDAKLTNHHDTGIMAVRAQDGRRVELDSECDRIRVEDPHYDLIYKSHDHRSNPDHDIDTARLFGDNQSEPDFAPRLQAVIDNLRQTGLASADPGMNDSLCGLCEMILLQNGTRSLTEQLPKQPLLLSQEQVQERQP